MPKQFSKPMEISSSQKYNISFIIPNYRSERYLGNNLTSVFGRIGSGIGFEVIIVNNDKEENLESVKNKFPYVKIINHGKNIGFGAAGNMGSKMAQGDYLFFLNPDCEAISLDIEKVIFEMEFEKNIGVLGGQLIDNDEKIQKWCAGIEISLANLVRNNLGFSKSCGIWRNKTKTETDWVSGTAMIIEKELFEELGGFDENFFMYFEDMDLCRRVREIGKKVIYYPELKIKHFGGGSYKSGKIQKNNYYDSQEYYFKKHYGKAHELILKIIRKIKEVF